MRSSGIGQQAETDSGWPERVNRGTEFCHGASGEVLINPEKVIFGLDLKE